MLSHNDHVREDIAKVNSKNDLNSADIRSIKGKMEVLEAHSRRNNIRNSGIPSNIDESWEECERKVRRFIEYSRSECTQKMYPLNSI